jgi:hypothetical protein
LIDGYYIFISPPVKLSPQEAIAKVNERIQNMPGLVYYVMKRQHGDIYRASTPSISSCKHLKAGLDFFFSFTMQAFEGIRQKLVG